MSKHENNDSELEISGKYTMAEMSFLYFLIFAIFFSIFLEEVLKRKKEKSLKRCNNRDLVDENIERIPRFLEEKSDNLKNNVLFSFKMLKFID